VPGSGPVTSWADIARQVFTLAGHDPNRATCVSTDEYFTSVTGLVAPRPVSSDLDMENIESTGFTSAKAIETLYTYIDNSMAGT
jgi:dTDP-4-dehydrorhamnose 3,5-epimerase